MPAGGVGSAALDEPLCPACAWLRALRGLCRLRFAFRVKARSPRLCASGRTGSLSLRVGNYSADLCCAGRKNRTGRGLRRGRLFPSAKYFAFPFRARPSASVFFLSCESWENSASFRACDAESGSGGVPAPGPVPRVLARRCPRAGAAAVGAWAPLCGTAPGGAWSRARGIGPASGAGAEERKPSVGL